MTFIHAYIIFLCVCVCVIFVPEPGHVCEGQSTTTGVTSLLHPGECTAHTRVTRPARTLLYPLSHLTDAYTLNQRQTNQNI